MDQVNPALEELIKVTHKKVEEGRVAVRACRHDALSTMERMQKGKEISEDDLKRGEEDLQKLTDRFIEEISELGRKKDAEIMEV